MFALNAQVVPCIVRYIYRKPAPAVQLGGLALLANDMFKQTICASEIYLLTQYT